MFNLIIVTAPTEEICHVYQNLLDDMKFRLPCLQNCSRLICVSDPQDRRVGSGGGTLNALDAAVRIYGDEIMIMKTLVVHSGGDSRRAPFHSVTGKAWATLNSSVSGEMVASPLSLLFEELSLVAERTPVGSLTVASCDVLLDVAPYSSEEASSIVIHNNCVTILCVPEASSTAKNHVSIIQVVFTIHI